jgi:TolB-like protein
VRRLFAMFLLCSTVGLIAATPAPRFTPIPQAAPTVTPGPVATGAGPAVLVYAFETPSDVDAKYGPAVAQIYTQVFTQSGGLKVLPVATNIKREDYEKYARVQHADYYISGFIQPIGEGAAIVAQIVDVSSDIVVVAQTTQIQSVPDVASQALNARAIILAHAGIDRPELQTVQNTPTPSSTAGASVSITNVLGGLFKGKSKAVATAATPTPAAKPRRGVIVVKVTGASSASDLASADDTLWRALGARYNVKRDSVPISNVAKQADSICGTSRDNTIASGVLVTSRSGGFRPHDTYSFTLNILTCFGATLYTNTQSGTDHVKVVRDAAQAYASDHPDNN